MEAEGDGEEDDDADDANDDEVVSDKAVTVADASRGIRTLATFVECGECTSSVEKYFEQRSSTVLLTPDTSVSTVTVGIAFMFGTGNARRSPWHSDLPIFHPSVLFFTLYSTGSAGKINCSTARTHARCQRYTIRGR